MKVKKRKSNEKNHARDMTMMLLMMYSDTLDGNITWLRRNDRIHGVFRWKIPVTLRIFASHAWTNAIDAPMNLCLNGTLKGEWTGPSTAINVTIQLGVDNGLADDRDRGTQEFYVASVFTGDIAATMSKANASTIMSDLFDRKVSYHEIVNRYEQGQDFDLLAMASALFRLIDERMDDGEKNVSSCDTIYWKHMLDTCDGYRKAMFD